MSNKSSSLKGFEIADEFGAILDLKENHSMSYKSDDDTNQNQYNKRSQNKSKTQQKVSKNDKFDEKVKSAAV